MNSKDVYFPLHDIRCSFSSAHILACTLVLRFGGCSTIELLSAFVAAPPTEAFAIVLAPELFTPENLAKLEATKQVVRHAVGAP